MIEASAARPATLSAPEPSPPEPEGLPSMCATAALHPDVVRAWIGYTAHVHGDTEGPTALEAVFSALGTP
jgi:hypothetical protein